MKDITPKQAAIQDAAVDQIRALEAAQQCIADVVEAYGRDCSRVVLDEAIRSLRDDAGKLINKALARLRISPVEKLPDPVY